MRKRGRSTRRRILNGLIVQRTPIHFFKQPSGRFLTVIGDQSYLIDEPEFGKFLEDLSLLVQLFRAKSWTPFSSGPEYELAVRAFEEQRSGFGLRFGSAMAALYTMRKVDLDGETNWVPFFNAYFFGDSQGRWFNKFKKLIYELEYFRQRDIEFDTIPPPPTNAGRTISEWNENQIVQIIRLRAKGVSAVRIAEELFHSACSDAAWVRERSKLIKRVQRFIQHSLPES